MSPCTFVGGRLVDLPSGRDRLANTGPVTDRGATVDATRALADEARHGDVAAAVTRDR